MDATVRRGAPRRKADPVRVWVALLVMLWVGPLAAAEYYVAVGGDDVAAGTLDAPFASVRRAQEAAEAGDTVYVRGGTYAMGEEEIARQRSIWAYVVTLDKSGVAGKPIRYWAYRDERPVFDFSEVKPPGRRVTAFYVTGSWLHLKGLTVTGVQVTMAGHTQSICFDNEGSNNIYEMLTMRDGQAIGFWLGRGSNNLVLHCDAYRNHDFTSQGGRGGNVDGFGFHVPAGHVGNVFRGCRAWFNSDDGFDFISAEEPAALENCWAFYNGYSAEFAGLGDGNGFKVGGYGIGPKARRPAVVPRHVIRGCVAARNRASGFYANHHPGGNDWIHNTAYRNRTNFNLLGRNGEGTADVPGFGHRMTNNLGYKARTELSDVDFAACDLASNSFTLPIKVEDRDFAGLDDSELAAPRGADGELPAMSFLHLSEGSRLIDRGADLGLPYAGEAPDLGAFEFRAEPVSEPGARSR